MFVLGRFNFVVSSIIKYKNELFCDLCGEYEDQQHLLLCKVLINNCEALYNDSTIQYTDLFGAENKQLPVVKLFGKVLEARQALLDELSTRRNNLVQCTI